MDDMRFLASGNSIQKVAIRLDKTDEAVFRWRLANAVTFDIANSETILFLRARSKKIRKEITNTRLEFGGQEIKFNNIATRWLGI